MSAERRARTCATCHRPLPPEPDAPWEWRMPEHGCATGVIGITQHGKSDFVKRWEAYLLSQRHPVVTWDLADEHSRHGRARTHTRLGPLSKRVTVREFFKQPEVLLDVPLALAVVPDDPFSSREEHVKQFRAFAPWVRRARPDGCVFVIEEVGHIAEGAQDILDDMAERWAKDGVLPIFVGQRWTHFTPGMRAELAQLVAFKQVKPSDLSLLARDAGRDFARALAHLARDDFRVADLHHPHRDALAELSP